LKKQVSNWNEITNQQSEYCAKLGVGTCTLLWKASQIQDAVESMLKGEDGNNFYQVAHHTLEYFVTAVQDATSKLDDTTTEYQFVLSLCGVLTNFSASPEGRDSLMTSQHGIDLVTSIMIVLWSLSCKESKWMKLRNLCLRFLYNISINEKGMQHLCTRKELITNVVDILKHDKCADNKLQVLRLLQSFICDEECSEIIPTITENLPFNKLRQLSSNARGEVKEALEELTSDLLVIEREQ